MLKLPGWLNKRLTPHPPTEMHRAQSLLAAIDAGGVPLNPAKVNEIARNFGLEVSKNAPVEDTIRRIRAAVARA